MTMKILIHLITVFSFILYTAIANDALNDMDNVQNSSISAGDILSSLKNIHNTFTKQLQNISGDVKWIKSQIITQPMYRFKKLALVVPGMKNANLTYELLDESETNGIENALTILHEMEVEMDNGSDPTMYKKVLKMKEILKPIVRKSPGTGMCGRTKRFGHEGNRYLVMFPEFKYGASTATQIMITTQQNINVSIHSPFPSVSRTIGVSATHGATLSLPPAIMQKGNAIELKGVLVESDSKFSLFGYNQRGAVKGEVYMGIPTKYLGTSYFIVGYKFGFVSIVALRDDTRVNITFNQHLPEPYNDRTYSSGQTLTVYLSKLSTFQLKGKDYLMNADIQSDKDVAVVSGSTCYAIMKGNSASYCNQLMSYVPPTDRLGYTFIVPHITRANYTYLFSYAKYSHGYIRISIQGHKYNYTRSFRGYKSYLRPSTLPYIIKTSQPSIIIQYTVFHDASTYPSQTMIPAITQYSNHYKFMTPSKHPFDHYAVIIIHADYVSGLRFDGSKIYNMDTDIKTVIDTDALYNVISLNITKGQHSVHHIDDDVVFGLLLYGFDTDQSYGMPAGLDLSMKSDCVVSKT